jgi:tetratricopeptide (TPR) repeat protein
MKYLIILLLAMTAGTLSAQKNAAEDLVDAGVKLHDKGDYEGAMKAYKKALALNANTIRAYAEMCNTAFALHDYDHVIEYSDRVIAAKSDFVDMAYMSKGSAQDMMGKPMDAIATYKRAIEAYPDNYLLYYNLAFTSYNVKDNKQAVDALQKGLRLHPAHASSHLLLGYIMYEEGHRVKSLLALYNFLLLEPASARSADAWKTVSEQLIHGVQKKTGKSINIFIADSAHSDEFRTADMGLSLLAASKDIDINKNKKPSELFADNTASFFSILGNTKKENTGSWWDYYVSYFAAMNKDKQVEAFSYYISQAKDDKAVTTWLKKNEDKVEALLLWQDAHKRR